MENGSEVPQGDLDVDALGAQARGSRTRRARRGPSEQQRQQLAADHPVARQEITQPR
jgi:hypothetical protein